MLPVADGNLKEWMEQMDISGASPADQRRLLPKWSECLVHALEYIHNQRVRHKDIKPANVLVKGDEILITDFGIAKDLLDEISSGSIDTHGVRTRLYSAPEVMTDHARRGRKADIFSLGCVILEMATVFLQESLLEFTQLRESEGPNFRPYYASLHKVLQWTEHLSTVFDSRIEPKLISRKWLLLPLLMLHPDSSERPTASELVQQLSNIPFGNVSRCTLCSSPVLKPGQWAPYDALQDYDISSARDALSRYNGSSGTVPQEPKHYFSVPFARNTCFIGRESQLSELRVATVSQSRHSRVAVTGLGGVGKTQLVLELAYRNQGQCSVFWVYASNLSRFEQSYLAIGQTLGIPGIDKSGEDVKLLVKEWLNGSRIEKWLMIVDNVDDLDTLAGQTKNGDKRTLLDYLPLGSRGSIIFTTRDRKTGIQLTKTNPILVEEFSLEDSTRLLQSSILWKDLLDVETKATELIELLGYHPLAIVQAASYISENQLPISEYVELYSEGADARIDLRGGDFLGTSRYNELVPVLSTWLISFEAIRCKEPLAAEYLSFICCLDRSGIPRSLLPRADGLTSGKIVNALGTLRAYSFINMRMDGKSFDVHRLIYQAGRYWLRENKGLADWTNKAAVRMGEVLPEGHYLKRAVFNTLLPHALHILDSEHLSAADPRVEHTLRYRVTWCLSQRADYVNSESMARKDVDLIESSIEKAGLQPGLGLEELLAAKNWVLECRYYLGDYPSVVRMAREMLSRTEALGPEHPQVMRCLNNLAIALRGLADYEASEATDRIVLERRRKVLGPDHPHTIKTMSNLANVLRQRGKLREAVTLHSQALNLRTKVLLYDEPDRLASINNLALVWQDLGRFEEAEEAHRTVLAIQQNTKSQDGYADDAYTWRYLTSALNGQGKFLVAEETSRVALELLIQERGVDHPDTLMTQSMLADILASQGRLEEAYPLACEATEKLNKSRGSRHPDTLASCCTLARLHYLRGENELAKKVILIVLVCRLATLGVQHHHTLKNVTLLSRYCLRRPEGSDRGGGISQRS